jgi:hypothetical protein
MRAATQPWDHAWRGMIIPTIAASTTSEVFVQFDVGME